MMETAWHKYWKDLFPKEYHEVVVQKVHRGDVVTDVWVIEFQHSHISREDILSREKHYVNLVWIIDARNAHLSNRLSIRKKNSYYTFRWKHSIKNIQYMTKQVVLDVGQNYLFLIKKFYLDNTCAGWGYPIVPSHFINQFNGNGNNFQPTQSL